MQTHEEITQQIRDLPRLFDLVREMSWNYPLYTDGYGVLRCKFCDAVQIGYRYQVGEETSHNGSCVWAKAQMWSKHADN